MRILHFFQARIGCLQRLQVGAGTGSGTGSLNTRTGSILRAVSGGCQSGKIAWSEDLYTFWNWLVMAADEVADAEAAGESGMEKADGDGAADANERGVGGAERAGFGTVIGRENAPARCRAAGTIPVYEGGSA